EVMPAPSALQTSRHRALSCCRCCAAARSPYRCPARLLLGQCSPTRTLLASSAPRRLSNSQIVDAFLVCLVVQIFLLFQPIHAVLDRTLAGTVNSLLQIVDVGSHHGDGPDCGAERSKKADQDADKQNNQPGWNSQRFCPCTHLSFVVSVSLTLM